MPNLIRHEKLLTVVSMFPEEHSVEIDLGPQTSTDNFHFTGVGYSWAPGTVRKGIEVYELATVDPDARVARAMFRTDGPGVFTLTAIALDGFDQLA